jgi:hypothetical protein
MAEVHEQVRPTVVLVPGAFVDGSGWEGVYTILKKDGYGTQGFHERTTS